MTMIESKIKLDKVRHLCDHRLLFTKYCYYVYMYRTVVRANLWGVSRDRALYKCRTLMTHQPHEMVSDLNLKTLLVKADLFHLLRMPWHCFCAFALLLCCYWCLICIRLFLCWGVLLLPCNCLLLLLLHCCHAGFALLQLWESLIGNCMKQSCVWWSDKLVLRQRMRQRQGKRLSKRENRRGTGGRANIIDHHHCHHLLIPIR